MNGKSILGILIGAAALTACAPADLDEGGWMPGAPHPTVTPNGLHVNGLHVNGLTSNGLHVNGTGSSGSGIGGINREGISVVGAQLVAEGTSGADLVGTVLTANRLDGGVTALRIDSVAQSSSDPDFWLYGLSFEGEEGWESACGHDEQGAARPAIALAGRWDYSSGTATGGDFIDDPDQLTLACAGSVLAKCAQMGYKPWQVIEECNEGGDCQALSLRDFHQACTRMIRADYCGDGQSHTVNGFPVNVWDSFSIQARAEVGTGWAQGAEWSPEGAVCIDELRYDPGGTVASYVAAHCPERQSAAFGCFSGQSTFFTESGYATPLAGRSLLRNEHDEEYLAASP